ncbi:putative alcohol dehydrogenase [Stachybotrys elegans]|uniref:Alcohol dehydrogenase n=1 Tax=Stachybotrys elegans TaxID=80388 RepID=A0A8K0SHV1_9HYPO|nr:putative alcohol dehydrogenase [Stachybotrys elegans]
MATAKAIVITEAGKSAAILDVPRPRIRDEWMIVRTKAVGLNPTDWKHIYLPPLASDNVGARVGSDYAGVVDEVGAKVTEFAKGDRVAGFSHGCNRLNHEIGAFGEYILVKASAAFKIPDDVSFEQAAMTGSQLYTCALGLYQSLQLPLPNEPAKEPFPVLIQGGSTGTGMLAIQLAKQSGLTVVTTASPANFDYLKWLGADAVFDYRSPTCGKDINEYTSNDLQYAWDCAGGEEICATALSSTKPSKYGWIAWPNNLELLKANPLIQDPMVVCAYDIFNEKYVEAGMEFNPPKETLEFSVMFKEIYVQLLEKKVLKPMHIDLNRNGSGLEGVMNGLNLLREGKVSCAKLVYSL